MATTLIIAFATLAAGLLAGVLLGQRGRQRMAAERQAAETERAMLATRIEAERQRHEAETAMLGRQLEEARQEHRRQQGAAASDYAQRLESQKQEAAEALRQAQAQADRTVQERKAELEERYRKEAEATRTHFETLMAEQDRRHKSDTAALEERFQSTVRMVQEHMENATNEMLKRRQEEFAASSHTNLSGIVNPLKETMEKMRKAMDDNSTEQKLMKESVKDNLARMIEQSAAAQRSAEELTRAFKHESKTQGDWGEVVLSNLLASQGFTEGKDFETQAVMRDEDGQTIQPAEGESMRPDVLLHLDDRRDIIIDSKVSMTAYINYVNAGDEAARRQHLREHVASLKRHVDELSAKNYPAYQVNPHLDFVIMFVPQVPALWAATQEEPALWQEAMQKKVFIADEHTLYAALRIIRITWTHIDQERNHQRLFELAQEMLRRTGEFLREFDTIGRNLQTALNAYDNGKKKLLPGGRSIGTTARQILAIGGLGNSKNSKGRRGSETVIPTEYLTESSLPIDFGGEADTGTDTPDAPDPSPAPAPDDDAQ